MIKFNHILIAKHTPQEMGITYDSYSRLLNDEEVTMKVLVRIANKLGISLKELMRYERDV